MRKGKSFQSCFPRHLHSGNVSVAGTQRERGEVMKDEVVEQVTADTACPYHVMDNEKGWKRFM